MAGGTAVYVYFERSASVTYKLAPREREMHDNLLYTCDQLKTIAFRMHITEFGARQMARLVYIKTGVSGHARGVQCDRQPCFVRLGAKLEREDSDQSIHEQRIRWSRTS